MISLELTTKADKALRKLAKDLGVDFRFLCADQMRLWCQDAAKRTPPLTRAMKQSKRQGRIAIENDLNAHFISERYEHPEVIAVWTTKNGGAGVKYSDGRVVFAWPERNAIGRDIARYMRDKRDKESGRLPRLKAAQRMVAKAMPINRGARTVAKGIGKLAAGWNRAGQYFAAKSRSTYKAAPWILAHLGSGDKRDTLTAHGGGDMMAVLNAPSGTWKRRLDRLIGWTQKNRERDITRHAAKRRDRIVEQWNRPAA